MKMKNGIVALLLLATGFTAGAQRTNNTYPEGAFHEETWFVGGGLGLNVGSDGEKFQSRTESHSGAGFALDAYAGYWLFENLAFRAGIRGITTSDQYTNFGKYKNLYLHGDALFKVGNGFIPYLHAGYAYINKGSVAGGAGLMFPIHLSRRVAVVPDISVAALSSRAFNNGTGSVGLATTATLGVYVSLGADRKHHDPEHWEAVETIGGTIWRLKPDAQNEEYAMVQPSKDKEAVQARPEKPKREKPAKPLKEKPEKEKPQKENPQKEKPAEPDRTVPATVPVESGSTLNNSSSNTLMLQYLPPEVEVRYPHGTPGSNHRVEVVDPIFDSNAPLVQTTVRQVPVTSTESAPEKTNRGEAAAAPCCNRVVYFEYNLSELSDLATGMLDELVAEMKTDSALQVLVVGHTDNRGSDDYNQHLSIERAEAVKMYLVEKGIAEGRIMTQGAGATEPAASNDNDGGRALNRRAVILNQK